MDIKQIVRSVQSKKPHLALLALSLLFMFGVTAIMGGLNRLLIPLLIGVGALIGLMFPLHSFWIKRSMQSVTDLLDQFDQEDRPELDPKQLKRGLASVDKFPLRNSLVTGTLWLLGLVAIVLVLDPLVGMTSWQISIVLLMGSSGALVDALLGYNADLRSLGPVRIALESMLPAAERQPAVSGNLSRRLLFSFTLIMLLFMSLFSMVWYGRARDSAVEREIASRSDMIAAVARRAQRAVGAKRDLAPEKLLELAAGRDALMSELAILDNRGQVIAGRDGEDREWLERIVDSQAESWVDLRTPFIYRRVSIDEDRSLIWIGGLDKLNKAIDSPAWTALLGGVLILAMCLVVCWSLVWSSLGPLRSLSRRIHLLGEGDLDQNVVVSGGGELASLAQALDKVVGMVRRMASVGEMASTGLNEHHGRLVSRLEALKHGSEHNSEIAERTAASVVEMRSSTQSISEQVDSLREATSDCNSTLFEIEQSVREVASSSDNLQGQVDDTSTGIKNITEAMNEILSNVEVLTIRAEEADSTISTMNSAIEQVQENANQTNRLSGQVSEIASRGADSVRETITGINEIQQVTDEAAEVINRLGTQMEAVGKILTVISDVARQTNLLALNAAIIAAAAGEHGKGFAVVADEIKDLADRTATSTKEIAGLIKAVQADSRRAVDAIERGSGSVNKGVQLAFNAGEALQQILNAVDQVDQMADEISRSTEEHTRLAVSISRYIGEMSKMLRDIRRATAEQSQNGAMVNRVSSQLADDARFVKRSAREQVQAVSGVNQNMERISDMVGFVGKAIGEQNQGVGHVARSAEEVRDASLVESAQLADVEEIVERIGQVAREMRDNLSARDEDSGL